MYTLAFDTAGMGCNIAIYKDGLLCAKSEKSMEFGQAEALMPQINDTLKKANITFADLTALFVCTGPGSFTGVRSGLAAARAFAFAAPQLQVGGINAFDAWLKTLAETEISDLNAVIIETRRDDFYVKLYDKHLKKLTEPTALTYDELLSLLKSKGCPVTLLGDGVERFLYRPSGLTIHAVKLADNLPIEALAAAGLQALQDKKIDYPKPLYLRAPDVTIKNTPA